MCSIYSSTSHVAQQSRRATVILALILVTEAFRSSPPRPSQQPWPTTFWLSSRTTANQASCARHASTNVGAALAASPTYGTAPAVALDGVIADLRTRIAGAPSPLPDNEEAQRSADALLSRSSRRFEVDSSGNIIGGEQREAQLAQALARDTFVLVRATCPETRDSLVKLSSPAECLLGQSRTVEEKLESFGAMRGYEEGVVAGYAGGGGYGSDQFLETRGEGGGEITPSVGETTAPDVVSGRRALATISSGVLRAVVRHCLPEVDPSAFLGLVDNGEGGWANLDDGPGREEAKMRLSSTPLRMCRYAGADGVAFGAHTDTTFLTVIPCASAPGLEILQPSTGQWLRPEAASDTEHGADVMLLAGELLQVLGQEKYHAAVHRVVRPSGLSEPRVSTPLLVRGAAEVATQVSMLPASSVACLAEERGVSNAEDTGSMPEVAGNQARLTMRDLWAALQFRAEPSDDTPLAISRRGREDEVRNVFGPFAPDGITVLSVDPLLVRLNGFASREDCDALIEEVAGSMSESTTWGGSDAQDNSNGVRSSSTTWVADAALPLLKEWTARVSVMSGMPSTFMEKWQVARYKPHGYFKLHTDHVDSFNGLTCGGRLGTLILYLNDDFSGGHTEFPELGVSVQPSAGDAIYFHSVRTPVERADADNMTVDERSAHAGLPVEDGNKWIATKWIHPLPYPNGREEPEAE